MFSRHIEIAQVLRRDVKTNVLDVDLSCRDGKTNVLDVDP